LIFLFFLERMVGVKIPIQARGRSGQASLLDLLIFLTYSNVHTISKRQQSNTSNANMVPHTIQAGLIEPYECQLELHRNDAKGSPSIKQSKEPLRRSP
jgi:hypothetical protein